MERKIAIIGSGYVGLVTGACFAEVGHTVYCVDKNGEKIAALQAGLVPIYEPGLDEIVKRNVAAGRLHFTCSTVDAIENATVVFIAVPTPPLSDGSVDLSFIEGVAREIADCLTSYRIIVDKSTVPVNTAHNVVNTICRYSKNNIEFDVVSNPEFLREGFAIEDFMKPDRIVIGVQSSRPVAAMREIYSKFNAPVIVTDTNSAELIKHAANSYLALKISFANALSVICEASGANVQAVTQGIGLDDRIGTRFLNAGLGFGGSCFPKDLSAFINISKQLGYDFRLLKEVQNINCEQMERFVKKIVDTLWVLRNKRIAVLGLAFKQNTDDVRQSPAIELCMRLVKLGAKLKVYDPKAMCNAQIVLPQSENVIYASGMYSVAENCDAMVIATEWPQFAELDLPRIKRAMASPIVFDGRNLLDPLKMEQHGFIYKSIGR